MVEFRFTLVPSNQWFLRKSQFYMFDVLCRPYKSPYSCVTGILIDGMLKKDLGKIIFLE